jgi:hypothetical protein
VLRRAPDYLIWSQLPQTRPSRPLGRDLSVRRGPQASQTSDRRGVAIHHVLTTLCDVRRNSFKCRAKVLELSWPDRPDIISFAMFYCPESVYDARGHLQFVHLAKYRKTYPWSYSMDGHLNAILSKRYDLLVDWRKWCGADDDSYALEHIRNLCDGDVLLVS